MSKKNNTSLIVTNLGNDLQWDAFVAAHPHGTIYHTSAWRRVIKQTFNYDGFYAVLYNERNTIRAGLPVYKIKNGVLENHWSCAPLAQKCLPLVENESDYALFQGYFKNQIEAGTTRYIEVKGDTTCAFTKNNPVERVEDFCTHVLDLHPPLDMLWNNTHKSCIRRTVKKAEQMGIEVLLAQSLEDVRQFYNLYYAMRKTYGLLPLPFNFFSTMWFTLRDTGNIDIRLASFNKKVISAILCLKYKNTVTYEYGSTLDTMHSTGVSPLLIWSAIKKAHEQGYHYFDLGRSTIDNVQLNEFKSRWGAQMQQLSYYYFPSSGGVASLRKKSLSALAMSLAVKNSPKPLVSLLSRILYRIML